VTINRADHHQDHHSLFLILLIWIKPSWLLTSVSISVIVPPSFLSSFCNWLFNFALIILDGKKFAIWYFSKSGEIFSFRRISLRRSNSDFNEKTEYRSPLDPHTALRLSCRVPAKLIWLLFLVYVVVTIFLLNPPAGKLSRYVQRNIPGELASPRCTLTNSRKRMSLYLR